MPLKVNTDSTAIAAIKTATTNKKVVKGTESCVCIWLSLAESGEGLFSQFAVKLFGTIWLGGDVGEN